MTSVKSHVSGVTLSYLLLNIIVATSYSEKIDVAYFDPFTSKKTDLDECLSSIMKHLPCNTTISVICSKADVDNIIQSVTKDECYSVIIRTFNVTNWDLRNDFYIIIAENVSELESGLFEMRKDMIWIPEAKFITTIRNSDVTPTEAVFQQFLQLKMYNVLYLIHKGNDTLIFTYYPFRNDNCGQRVDEIVHLGNCSETYYNQIPTNNLGESRNCKLKAVKFQDKIHKKVTPGKPITLPIVEQYIFDTFAFFFNFTVDYRVIKTDKYTSHGNIGIVLPNGTATGILNYLENNLADVAIGSAVLTKNRAKVFDFIGGFNYASFNLYTSGLGKEIWKKMYREFDSTTYLVILLFYCLIILVFVIFHKTSSETSSNYTYLLIKLWGFFYLGNGTVPYPKLKRLRFVTLCWIWFTFFISSFYNSDMYSLITGHIQHVHQIDPNELRSIPYKPCIPQVIRTFFKFAYNEDFPENYQSPACNMNRDEALDTTANGTDLYTLLMAPLYAEREMEFIDEHGNRKLDVWDFGMDVVLGFYVVKGFPFKEKLLNHAQYMFQSGLAERYIQIMYSPRSGLRHRGASEPFKLGDFRVHFGILIIGSIISSLTFVIEYLSIGRYRRKMYTY